jgi:hypothetical protein
VTLLAEIVGVLALGTLVARVGRTARLRHGLAAHGVLGGAGLVAVAVAGVLLCVNGIRLVSSMPASISTNDAMPGAVVEEQPEIEAEAVTNTAPFLDWARARLTAGGARPTYWLIRGGVLTGAFQYQWATYKLLPAREVQRPESARWLVFDYVEPSRVAYDRGAFRPPIELAPGYAIAERRGAP